MPLIDTFPDAEAAASWILRQAGIASGRVYSSIPSSPTYPLVVIERIGGIPADRIRLDRARIQINCWGTSKSNARQLAADARTAIMLAQGTSLTTGGGAPVNCVITGVDDDLGLFWSPDNATDKDRYIFGVEIFLHAIP